MRKTMTVGMLGTLLAIACSSPSATTDGTPGPDGASSSGTDGTTDPGSTDPGSSSGASSSGASSGAPVAANLAVAAVTFRQVGRKGDDLQIDIEGTDTLKRTSAAVVRFLDENDQPVANVVDTDWDGTPDAAEKRFHFEASTMGQASFKGTILVKNAFSSAVKKVSVALEDDAGGHSAAKSASLAIQALRDPNAACDPAKILDRCPAGMACSGTPATCHDGTAPTLSKVVYVGGTNGRMLFKGSDADEDLARLTIEFLDASTQPVAVSMFEGGDATSGIELTATPTTTDGPGFFFDATPSPEFSSQVAKVAATATDKHGFASTRVITARASFMPSKSAGQTCDPDGLDACASGLVCAPGLATAASNTCTSATTVRTKKCAAFAALDPSKGAVRAFGKVEGTSLWDPPDGCTPSEAKGRPEAAIPLRLAKPAKKLTVTTALPETDFDTAVYIVPSCAATTAVSFGCNDDDKGFTSTLVANDVPAGDYTILVESIPARGGHFGVAVTTE